MTAPSVTVTYGEQIPVLDPVYEPAVEPTLPATCDTTATHDSPVGTYPVTCDGASLAGHTFTYVDGEITIEPREVTVQASSDAMRYGEEAPEITASYLGLLGVTEPGTPAVCSTEATSASAVGTYASSCADAADPNHSFVYEDGTVTVEPAPAVVTASSAAITAGDEIPEIVPSYSGLVNDDVAPATAPVCSTTATADSPAGEYPTTCADAADPNYEFTYVDGVLTIAVGVAPVTVTASSVTVDYGDEVPAITASYDGLTGDLEVPEVEAVCSTTATAGSPAGEYPTVCADAADPGHVFTYVNGTVTILPVTATVTASSGTSTYGDAVDAVTPSYSGLVAGDTAPATAPECSTDATSSSGVGVYATTCVGAADPNYVFNVVDGVHEITPAAATVTASSATISEGDAIPEITPIYTGLVNDDVAPATPPVCSTTATSESPAGEYATSCEGAEDPNYVFTAVEGVLTIEAVVPLPEPTVFGNATYVLGGVSTTTTGSQNLPTGTINAANPSGAGFGSWVNLTMETTTGFHEVFCNGRSSSAFTTCTLGDGQTFPGGWVSNLPLNQFDVYDLVGGADAVEPSSLVILEDVPEAVRAGASTVTATDTHGLITYVQQTDVTGQFSLKFGICDAGTATFSAADPSCKVGELTYNEPTIARIGARISVSIVSRTIYNNFPIAAIGPENVEQGEEFTMSWATAPGAMPQREDGSILGAVTVNYGSTFAQYIPIPEGVEYVPGSARLVGGDARMSDNAVVTYCEEPGGECEASLSGNYDFTTQPYLKLSVPNEDPGRVPGGRHFSFPTLEADFVATGAEGDEVVFGLTQYRNITRTAALGGTTADFRGYATESTTTSSAPAKAAPRVMYGFTIG